MIKSLKKVITLSALLTATSCGANLSDGKLTIYPESTKISSELERKVNRIHDVRDFGSEILGLHPDAPHYLTYREDTSKITLYILDVTLPTLLPDSRDDNHFSIEVNQEYRDIPKGSVYIQSKVDNLKDEAKHFASNGYDVYWRSTTNYNNQDSDSGSTINPIFLKFSELSQTQTVLHENCHASVYRWIGSFSSELNESFCQVVGYVGAVEYYKSRFGQKSKEHKKAMKSFDSFSRYSFLFNSYYHQLQTIYKNDNLTFEKKMTKRKEIFDLIEKKLGETNVNNSLLWDRRPYSKYFHLMLSFHKSHGGNLNKTLELIQDCPNEEKEALEYIRDNMGPHSVPKENFDLFNEELDRQQLENFISHLDLSLINEPYRCALSLKP
jgi:hypothetical protein